MKHKEQVQMEFFSLEALQATKNTGYADGLAHQTKTRSRYPDLPPWEETPAEQTPRDERQENTDE